MPMTGHKKVLIMSEDDKEESHTPTSGSRKGAGERESSVASP